MNDSKVSPYFVLFNDITSETAGAVCSWIIKNNEDRENGKLSLYICSPGGEIRPAFAMIEVIKSSNIPISTVAMGEASSAGFLLFASGTRGYRITTPSCTFLSHNYSTEISGNHAELMTEVTDLKWLNSQMVKVLHEATDSMTEAEIEETLLRPQGTYLHAEDVLRLGFADYSLSYPKHENI